MTAVITLPSVRVLIQVSFVANKEGKNDKFQKLHCPLEQDYGQENGDISIFAFPLATVISFCHTVACNFLHLWKSTCQVSLCLYINVVNEIKPSQLKNCLVIGYEKHHRMPWKKCKIILLLYIYL